MKKKFLAIAMLSAVVLTGCVSKKELEASQQSLQNCTNEKKELYSQLQTSKDQTSDTKELLAAANARIKGLEDQLVQTNSNYQMLQQSLDRSLTNSSENNINISKLVDQINESNQYIRHLVEVKSKSDSLNMVLTNNLTRSLSKEELKEVDV